MSDNKRSPTALRSGPKLMPRWWYLAKELNRNVDIQKYGCWIWTGNMYGNGYGRARVAGKQVPARADGSYGGRYIENPDLTESTNDR